MSRSWWGEQKMNEDQKHINATIMILRLQSLILFFGALVILAMTTYRVVLPNLPMSRNDDLNYMAQNFSFLKPPQKKLDGIFEEVKRNIVVINDSRPGRRYETLPVVLYMAEVEAKVGRQDWLDEAYQTYAMTTKEWERLMKLEFDYNNPPTVTSVEGYSGARANFYGEAANSERNKVKDKTTPEQVLKERNLLSAIH